MASCKCLFLWVEEACLAFTVAFLLLPSGLLLPPRPLNTFNHGHTMEERPGWEKAKQGSEGTFVWDQMIQEETSARSCICRRKLRSSSWCLWFRGWGRTVLIEVPRTGPKDATCSQPVTQVLRRGPVSETTGVLTAIPRSPGQCLSPWPPSPFPPPLLPILDVIRLASSAAACWNFSMARCSFFTQILAFFLSMKSFPQLDYISPTSF